MKSRNVLMAIFGIWFIISPWALGFSSHVGAIWTSVVLGAVLLIVSVWAARLKNASGVGAWQSWVNLILGIWFIIQPFTMSLGAADDWISVILGAITIILAVWNMRDEANDHV